MHIRVGGIIFLGLAALLGCYAVFVPSAGPEGILVTALFAILGFGLLERSERTRAVADRVTALELKCEALARTTEEALLVATHAGSEAAESKKLASRATLAGRG